MKPGLFRTQLRDAIKPHGTTAAAALCGVTARTIRLWLAGKHSPSLATQTGALILLRVQPSNKSA